MAKDKVIKSVTNSVDSLLETGLQTLGRAMQAVNLEIFNAGPSRESINNLKDIMAMLHEIKKREAELTKDLSEDELVELVRSGVAKEPGKNEE